MNLELLINGAYIVKPGSEVLESGAIGIAHGRIAYIGPVDQELTVRAGRVIDAVGRLAMPGLVNSHTHAAMVLFRGYADDLPLREWLNTKIFPIEAKLTPEDVYWGTLLACAEMIKSGTTAFADMYFHMDEVAEAVKASGMRASLSMGMTSFSDNPDEVLAKGLDFASKWNGAAHGRISAMLGPHAPYTCTPEFMTKTARAAKAHGIRVHTHVSETFGEDREIREKYGMSPAMLLKKSGLFEAEVLAAHCVALTDEDISILADNGVFVAHNPGSNMKLASGVAPVPKMLEKGITVGLGTDGAASNNNLDMFEEMRLAALLHKAVSQDPETMPARTCLAMGTSAGAACLGFHDIGGLEVGKKADIVILNMNSPHFVPKTDCISHIVYSAGGADVETVLVDGTMIMENRRLVTVSEEEIMAEAASRAARLRDSV